MAEARRDNGDDIARRLALAVRAAEIGIWDWNLITGQIVYSDRAKEICGFPLDQPVRFEQVAAAIHPEDRPSTLALAKRAIDPEIRDEEVFRYRIIRADNGEIRWVLAHGEAVFGIEEGQERALRYVGTLQDITEQKQSEDALVESEARLRLAVEASQMAVWELDVASGTVTPSAELNRLFGFPDEARPTIEEFRALYGPGERERIQQEGQQVQARGETRLQTEFRHLRTDGSEGWLLMRAQIAASPNGGAPRVIGVLLDITDRKRAEERFREMADNAPVMVWIGDTQHNLSFMSRSWYELTGQEPGAALGSGWLDCVHADDREHVRSLSLHSAKQPVAFNAEYRLRRRDGSWRWVLDAAAPRYDKAGNFVGHIGSIIDITDRRLAEERRALLVNELNHRVKNTLATVQAMVAQTLRSSPLGKEIHRSLDGRLVALAKAHDVLTREHWEGAELLDVIEQALSPFDESPNRRVSREGANVRLSPKAALAMSMAFHELATNATKYGALSTGAGRIGVKWRIDAEAEPNLLILEWREEHGPPVSSPTRKGFGSRLIERSTADALGGTVEVSFEPAGLVCRMVMPLAEVSA